MVTEANDAVASHPSTAVMSPSTSTAAAAGLIISITDATRSFLTTSSANSHLSEDLRDLSSSLSIQSTVPYNSLKTIWFRSKPETRPDLSSLLAGSDFVFTSPKPREKSEELKVRLRKLEEAAERKAYDELVKDITPTKGVEEPFSSYKDQLGFGLHVVVTMFTGYLVGYAAFRALFSKSPAMSAAGGILGLVGAMLVETFLFILRYSDLGAPSPSSTSHPSNLRIKKNQ
ncbi:ER-based factor for assembly of V-ATPase [Perilla frutescens var. hirtella]|nr:ER-based factor for assembly of V-ATPase [Perilla frutescens var. frutescens]KAH6792508.1 ER-based factor for assembly of V-ATPase [Perilla frutescens var. hirtella]